jgi:HJR/Mrr/RecB family endonuclease
METAKRAKMLSGEGYNLEYDGFLGELKSMTTLIKDGQTTVLDVALQTGMIDEELQDFIFGQLIFFMLTSKREKSKTIEQVADSIGALTTSLTAMAYASSLMTATESDVIG